MAKKKIVPTNKPVAESYVHIHQGKMQETLVNVHINYVEGLISLIDYNPKNPSSVCGKQWKFSNREIEYMQSWQDILDAMKSAITEATEKLEAYQKIEEEAKLLLAMRVQEATE